MNDNDQANGLPAERLAVAVETALNSLIKNSALRTAAKEWPQAPTHMIEAYKGGVSKLERLLVDQICGDLKITPPAVRIIPSSSGARHHVDMHLFGHRNLIAMYADGLETLPKAVAKIAGAVFDYATTYKHQLKTGEDRVVIVRQGEHSRHMPTELAAAVQNAVAAVLNSTRDSLQVATGPQTREFQPARLGA